MRKLEVTQQAQTEIIEIKSYTSEHWGLPQAIKYLAELQSTINLLRESPLVGVKREDLSNKIYSFPYASHMVYYQFNEKVLYLLAVMHKNRLPKNHLKDIDS